MKILDEIHINVTESQNILGSMIQFAEGMKKEVDKVKITPNHGERVSLLREVRGKLRWESRGFRQLNRKKAKLVRQLKKIKEILPASEVKVEESFITKLATVHNSLLRLLSFFVGDTKHDLVKLMRDEKSMDKNPQRQQRFLQAVSKLGEDIDEVIKWAKGGDALLKQLDIWDARLERMAQPARRAA